MKLHTREKWIKTIQLIVEAVNKGELTPEEAVDQLDNWGWIAFNYGTGTKVVRLITEKETMEEVRG